MSSSPHDHIATTRHANTANTSLRHLRGLLWAMHPLPGSVFTLAVGIFGWLAAAAAGRPIEVVPMARLLVAVFCTQIAIGSMNDYCDRHLDIQSHRAKPIALGMIAPWEALVLAMGATLLLLLVAVPLGPLPLALLLVIEGLGLAYDLRFKGTPVSALLYAVYFPLNPLLAWSVFGSWQPFLPWLIPMGALLGISMNISNSLPDLEADIAMGVRGLPHLLGPRLGKLIAWGTPPLLLAVVWILHLSGVVPAHGPGLLIGTAVGLLSVLLAMSLYAIRPTAGTLRLNFTLQAIGTVGLAAGWLAAVAL